MKGSVIHNRGISHSKIDQVEGCVLARGSGRDSFASGHVSALLYDDLDLQGRLIPYLRCPGTKQQGVLDRLRF